MSACYWPGASRSCRRSYGDDDQGEMRPPWAAEPQIGQRRPEILGMTIARHGDGGFKGAVSHTSQEQARRGEQAPAPPDVSHITHNGRSTPTGRSRRLTCTFLRQSHDSLSSRSTASCSICDRVLPLCWAVMK
jgi:hypothetical protein